VTDTLKFGILGCGHQASGAHIPVLAKMQGVEVAALADADPACLARCSTLAPNARTFANWNELIDSGDLHAVIISLPTHLHADAAVAAFESGLDVYLEKPIASTLSDANRIVDAWRNSGRVCGVGYNYRFNPLFASLAEQVRRGDIGKPLTVETVFTIPALMHNTWRGSRATGGGAVLDLATHHIDLLRWMLGCEVVSVSARIESRATDHDWAELGLTFETGVTAVIRCAYGEAFTDSIAVRGASGVRSVNRARSFAVEKTAESGWRGRLPTPAGLGYLARKFQSPFREPSCSAVLSSFVEAVRARSEFRPDPDDGFAALLVASAAEESASSQLPVTMADYAESAGAQAAGRVS
jgi:predicted dehydrogenase